MMCIASIFTEWRGQCSHDSSMMFYDVSSLDEANGMGIRDDGEESTDKIRERRQSTLITFDWYTPSGLKYKKIFFF